jgi:hypothetical protein
MDEVSVLCKTDNNRFPCLFEELVVEPLCLPIDRWHIPFLVYVLTVSITLKSDHFAFEVLASCGMLLGGMTVYVPRLQRLYSQ